MFKKWFLIGMASAIPGVLLLVFQVSWDVGFFLTLLGGFACLAIAGITNFGRGYWTSAGYSHSLQRPWPIPPVKRPRIGGFATGYALLALPVFYTLIFGGLVHFK